MTMQIVKHILGLELMKKVVSNTELSIFIC